MNSVKPPSCAVDWWARGRLTRRPKDPLSLSPSQENLNKDVITIYFLKYDAYTLYIKVSQTNGRNNFYPTCGCLTNLAIIDYRV